MALNTLRHARRCLPLLAVAAALLLSGCASLPSAVPRPESSALPASTDTTLGKLAAATQREAQQSGFRLLFNGGHSLHARLELARRAQRSLDVQYYHLKNDATYRADIVSGIGITPSPSKGAALDADDAFTKIRKRNWARLLRKILEVDPIICPRCGVEMKIIAVITDPLIIDKILAHVGSGRGHDPFEPRAPPVTKTG